MPLETEITTNFYDLSRNVSRGLERNVGNIVKLLMEYVSENTFCEGESVGDFTMEQDDLIDLLLGAIENNVPEIVTYIVEDVESRENVYIEDSMQELLNN